MPLDLEAWLIWSNEHGAWWGPDSCGYYPRRAQAGRYTKEQADQIVRNANHGGVRNEVAIEDAPATAQERCSWTEETMQIINRLTPDIKGKAFDSEWFLLRQRFEQFDAAADRSGESLSAWLRRAGRERVIRDRARDLDLLPRRRSK